MAIFSPGPIAQAVSGSIASITFRSGRGSPVIMGRSRACDRETTAQLAQRANLETIGAKWRGLTLATRTAWTASAARHAPTNALGLPAVMSGFAFFVKIQRCMAATPWPPITSPPASDSAITWDSPCSWYFWNPWGMVLLCGSYTCLANPCVTWRIGRTFSSATSAKVRHWGPRKAWVISNPGALIPCWLYWRNDLGDPVLGERVAIQFYLYFPMQLASYTQTLYATNSP